MKMTREKFMKCVDTLYHYQQAIFKLQDIIGMESDGSSFFDSMVDEYGNLLLDSVVSCSIDDIPEDLFTDFWDFTLNYGAKSKVISELYDKLSNL